MIEQLKHYMAKKIEMGQPIDQNLLKNMLLDQQK